MTGRVGAMPCRAFSVPADATALCQCGHVQAVPVRRDRQPRRETLVPGIPVSLCSRRKPGGTQDMPMTLRPIRSPSRCSPPLALASTAFAQPNCPAMRKINIGVSVAPPNVVHTSPYVAKALGYFEKRCIDANIVQFEGGQSQTSAVAAAQGSAIVSVSDVSIGRGLKVQQIWGARAAHAAGLHGAGRDQDRGRPQGQAAVGDRRRRRRLQLADGPRGAQVGQARRRRRAVHPLADRGPPARPDRRPDRRRGAASRGRVPGAAAEVDAAPAGAARRADAALHVQRLWRLDRLDRQGPRRCCATPSPP